MLRSAPRAEACRHDRLANNIVRFPIMAVLLGCSCNALRFDELSPDMGTCILLIAHFVLLAVNDYQMLALMP